MIVLGIDPGSRLAGYGLIEKVGKKINYINSGVLKYSHISNFNQRLALIYESVENLSTKYSPDHISLESLIFVKSPTSLMKLAQARGAMLAALVKSHGENIFEYAPNEIKSAVCGHGHSDKESIQKSLDMLIGKKEYKSHDESDALAIAFCHIVNHNNLNFQKKSKLENEKKSLYKKKKNLRSSLAHMLRK